MMQLSTEQQGCLFPGKREDVWEQAEGMAQGGAESDSSNPKTEAPCPSAATYVIEASVSSSLPFIFT